MDSNNKYPLYPEFNYFYNNGAITIQSTIRVESDGKWFLWDVIEITKGNSMELLLKRFIATCYSVILLGRVDENLIDSGGFKIFKLDINQESEKERLYKKIN